MSGLCGWLADSPEFIAVMAAPLSRFDESPLQTRTSPGGSVAVAACDGASHLYQQDGLLVALWGHPVLDGSALNVAQRLAPIWLARGAAACAALSGEFALAIVDGASGQLLLAVDRAGSYPLSYVDHAQGVFFASSNDALLAHPAVRGALDPQALYHYLFFHMVPAPETPWLGWQRLLPGEYLHVCAGKQCKGSYWSLAFQEKTIDHLCQPPAGFFAHLAPGGGKQPGRCGGQPPAPFSAAAPTVPPSPPSCGRSRDRARAPIRSALTRPATTKWRMRAWPPATPAACTMNTM